jgi:superfamily I DNA/RNA helicase
VEFFSLPGYSLPDFLIVSQSGSLFAVGLLVFPKDGTIPLDEGEYRLSLAKRTAQLKRYLGLDQSVSIRARVWKVSEPKNPADQNGPKMFDAPWALELSGDQAGEEALSLIRSKFAPSITFEAKPRHFTSDPNLQGRRRERFTLDEKQALAVYESGEKGLFVTGPAGSGKTLVLLARIKSAILENRRARVLLVCFNKSLAAQFAQLLEGYPAVSVRYFHGLIGELGLRFPSDASEEQSLHHKDRASERSPSGGFDLVLVDEIQDFKVGWIQWLATLSKSGTRGVVVAGDVSQSIYQTASPRRDKYLEETFAKVELSRSYRCTNQILQVIEALEPGLPPLQGGKEQEGEPVELIWAQNKLDTAMAVSKQIKKLLSGGEFRSSDMAVLAPNYYWLQGEDGIVRALAGQGIRVEPVWRSRGDLIDFAADRVKVMTIHSSKGLEFPVVFLVGLEAIEDRIDEADEEDDEAIKVSQRSKLNVVGPSRARDLLFIYYSKSNETLRRLRGQSLPILERVYPDDFEEN